MAAGRDVAGRMPRRATNDWLDGLRPAVRLAWIAGHLFAERGYGATSIRDIAAAAGVAPSSVYSHYRSKDELLDAFLNESHAFAAASLRSTMLQNAGRPPCEQLGAIVGLAADAFIANPAGSLLSRAELRRARPEATIVARQMRADAAEILADVIRHGRAAGEFRSAEPAAEMASVLFSTVRQAGHWLSRWPVAPVPDVVAALGAFARRIATEPVRVAAVELPYVDPPGDDSTAGRLLAAAVEHIAGSGYTDASMREIATSVGIRPPSIYEHYPSKAHLLAAVIGHTVGRRAAVIDTALARTDGADVLERTVAVLRDLVGTCVAAPEVEVATDADYDQLPAELAAPLSALHAASIERLANLVREGRDAGRFRYGESTALVTFGILALTLQASWLVLEFPDLDRPAVVADVVGYALRVLAVDDGDIAAGGPMLGR